MNIKNYTSTVPSMLSSAAIEALLVEAGATAVSKWYAEKSLVGFMFEIPVGAARLVFRLPANEELVYKLMLSKLGKANPSTEKRISIRAQAARTAWRTLHEWVQLQVAMIQLQQVEALQVFLPFNYSQDTGATFYDSVKTGNVKLLA
ncbi:hypothetical protein QMK33_19335 [Hymenobacter sp. H14-R3]|uniref:hypothetical protein n=1 Tax=Hymenobacter sp. H14-R3 TaxID=3046308 RepID=UPI0024B9678D|nr:hypothetical protein [Hymenobacter sp. H14-R3]MDJ0367307.1 hypothetical protein [Hymenobacter sp. H14-R3]